MNPFSTHTRSTPRLATPPVQATFSGIVAGMLPSRDAESIEVAIKATETGKIYDCTVPLSIAREVNLQIGAAVEVIGVEAAPRYVRAVGLAVFR
jgi:hypothetical protein